MDFLMVAVDNIEVIIIILAIALILVVILGLRKIGVTRSEVAVAVIFMCLATLNPLLIASLTSPDFFLREYTDTHDEELSARIESVASELENVALELSAIQLELENRIELVESLQQEAATAQVIMDLSQEQVALIDEILMRRNAENTQSAILLAIIQGISTTILGVVLGLMIPKLLRRMKPEKNKE